MFCKTRALLADRNMHTAWRDSAKVLMRKAFQQKLSAATPAQIGAARLPDLARVTDARDFKPAKLFLENALASDLATFLKAAVACAK